MANNGFPILIVIAFLVVFGCSNDGTELIADFSQLDRESYILEVNRIAEHPDVQFPFEQLQETDYEETDQGTKYEVSFSEIAQTITIVPGPIAGRMEIDEANLRQYELYDGLFAGGRFNVWITNNHFEAEYTVYGSGVPIITSERGKLLPAD